MSARIPPRAWIATVTLATGQSITATIYGPNASVAETDALRDRPDAVRVIVRVEAR